jgi:myo-inositol-1(or 4)-monophosphatase
MTSQDPATLNAFQAIAEEVAKQAGKFLLGQAGIAKIREKAPGDYVTSADEAAQALIFSELSRHFPSHSLLGEEESTDADWKKGFCWVIDPIDGTRNFIYGLPSFSVSIALMLHGQPIVGVVHDPMLAETYVACSGRGAWVNGKSIAPTAMESLDQSLLVCSFPARVHSDTPELMRFNRVVQRATLRRLGSAALNLCYVACGRLDGYWATSLSLWDFAAGMLIAKEAGAATRDLDGLEFRFEKNEFCVTSTTQLGDELLPLLRL